MNRIEIDLATWHRAKHFELFSAMDYPHFSMTADLDVTPLIAFVKSNQLSLFKSILYLTTRLCNDYEPFRLRLDAGKLYLYEQVDPSFTYLLTEDLYSYVTISYTEDYPTFTKAIETYIESHQGEVCVEDQTDINALLFMTSMPWIKYNDIQHPIGMNPVDSIPRICWGKYEENFKGRLMMPVSVQVHHALMDGLHLNYYYQKLQEMFLHPENWLLLK